MKELLSPEEIEALEKTPTHRLFEDRLEVMSVGTGPDIKIQHFISPEELANDMRINPLDVENAMISLASHYARYTYLLAKARLQKDDAERRLELLEAKLDKVIRDKAAKSAEKLTEPKIEAMIKRQESYIKATLAFNEARAVYQVLEGAVSAMDKKYGMLVQLNKNQNAEMERTTAQIPNEDLLASAKKNLVESLAKKKKTA